MGDGYRIHVMDVQLTSGVAAEFILAQGAQRLMFKCTDVTVGWAYHSSEDACNGGGGFPLAPGETLVAEGPFEKHSLWLRQASGATKIVRVSYEYPSFR